MKVVGRIAATLGCRLRRGLDDIQYRPSSVSSSSISPGVRYLEARGVLRERLAERAVLDAPAVTIANLSGRLVVWLTPVVSLQSMMRTRPASALFL
jgi:hypothetical protein